MLESEEALSLICDIYFPLLLSSLPAINWRECCTISGQTQLQRSHGLGEYKANMLSAFTLRAQIEAALAQRIPSALTPPPREIRPTSATGIQALDELLQGGLPVGAVSEIAGPACSGRTSLALRYVAEITQSGKVCAWVDVSDEMHPESAAATGVALTHLLWVRCGVATTGEGKPSQNGFTLPLKYLIPGPIKRGLHGGGFGPHPRTEAKGLSDSVRDLLRAQSLAPRCAEQQHKPRPWRPAYRTQPANVPINEKKICTPGKPWSRIDQALRVTDLLLQAGGFGAIVLDLGSIAAEYVSRIPLATWFRYRAAAERTQVCVLLLTQHSCAKSSAGLVLHLEPGKILRDEPTVFTGIEHCIAVARQRFTPAPANVVPLRKPPQRERSTRWQSRTSWAGSR